MIDLILRLKSGKEFRFKCTEYKIEKHKYSGEICAFEYKAGKGECPLFFKVEDIESISRIVNECEG